MPMRLSRVLPTIAACLALLTLSSCADGDRNLSARTFNMGERIPLGHLTYTVFETQWLTHMGDGAEARIPESRFYLVRVVATNGGGGTATVPTFSVENDKGDSFPELSNGDGVPQWIGYLRMLKSGESAQGNALFDVPPGHYKLRLKDESGDKAALIDIPLSFGAETPDIPAPGPAPGLTPGIGKK